VARRFDDSLAEFETALALLENAAWRRFLEYVAQQFYGSHVPQTPSAKNMFCVESSGTWREDTAG
jgi:hypothetical protein